MFLEAYNKLSRLQSEALADAGAEDCTRIRVILEAERVMNQLAKLSCKLDKTIWQAKDRLKENRKP